MTASRENAAPASLTPEQVRRCLGELRRDFGATEVVYRGKGRILVRWRDRQSGQSVIVKLWARPDLKGGLRRLLRLAACDHEDRTMKRLRAAGMAVPRPLGTARLAPAIAGYTDALFMEDLGQCESSGEFFKRLVREGREDEATRFEDALIEMTQQIVRAGMLDYDHGFVNTVVPASGRPVRIDFEVARRVVWPRLFPALYGRMLGHVILLHAFAAQPEVARTVRFAARLRARLDPPPAVLKRASAYVQTWLADQQRRRRIDTRLRLPWD